MDSISSNHSNVKQLLRQIGYPKILKTKMRQKGFSLSTLSSSIGKNATYFQRKADTNDYQVSMLIALSMALQENMLEPFLNVLPEALRITQKEKELQAEIAELQKQLSELGKERDIYKNIVFQTRQ